MIRLLLVAGLAMPGLVQRLGDERPEERRSARAALIAAGEEAVPHLARALEAPDAEVRRGAARVLDRIFDRTALSPRRCPDYEIPENKHTHFARSGRWPAQLLLERAGQVRALASQFRGILREWEDPARADYNYLLLELARRFRAVATRDGDDLLIAVFVAEALLWKLERIEPPAHWSTRWAVRRSLLPALRDLLLFRGERLTVAEGDLHLRVLALVEPLCDPVAGRIRREAVARLKGHGLR